MSRSWPALRRGTSLLLLPLGLAACGDGAGGTEEAADDIPRATPLEVQPLSDDDLAGLDPTKVSINMPWGGGTVSRDPAPRAARATVRSAVTEERSAFDRLVLEVGTEAPFPGYRVAWADSTLTLCGTETPVWEGEGARPLLVRLRPAQAHEDSGEPTVQRRDRRTGFPAVMAARQICDEGALVEWLLEVEDSAAVRVLEMRDPPRLVVDVAHPGAVTGGAGAPAAGTGDSAAGPSAAPPR